MGSKTEGVCDCLVGPRVEFCDAERIIENTGRGGNSGERWGKICTCFAKERIFFLGKFEKSAFLVNE